MDVSRPCRMIGLSYPAQLKTPRPFITSRVSSQSMAARVLVRSSMSCGGKLALQPPRWTHRFGQLDAISSGTTFTMAARMMVEPSDDEEIAIHPDGGDTGAVSLTSGDVHLRGASLTQRSDQTEEAKERNRKRFFRRVFGYLRDKLGSVDALIGPHLRDVGLQTERPANFEDLHISMERNGKLMDLFALQSYLIQAEEDIISNALADYAKSAMLSGEINIRHFSMLPSDDAMDDPNTCTFKVFLGNESWGTDVTRLLSRLGDMLPEYRDRITLATPMRSQSVWVTVVVPRSAAKTLKLNLKRQNVHNYLSASGISRIIFTGKKASANPLKQEKEEASDPPPKKARMDPKAGTILTSSEREPSVLHSENGTRHQWMHWKKIDVLRYFNECSLPKAVIELAKLDFTGKDLENWDLPSLKEKGLKDDVAKMVMAELAKLQKYRESVTAKLIQDCLHGPMDFHPLCVRIMDTPEFQRLRNIKQLGSVYLVYPGAAHNRFEHSLGVGFLTNGFVKSLKARQPELGINEVDVLCVTIAGLCHDLGQGPHSRLFEEFMHTVEKKQEWKHEDAAYMMFDHLIEKNGIRPEMFRYGLTETDIQFIREQVRGKAGDKSKYRGRDKKKSFLYEIVAQRQNGIDVNKWDYIARDSLMLGMPNSFDYRRFIMHARAIDTEEGYRICARDKDADDHYKMFQSRYSLGRRAYFHKVHQSIEAMLLDILLDANKSSSIKYTDEYRQRICLSQCAYDPVAFTKLTDSIFDLVELSTSSDLQEAREIMENIRHRRFYKTLAETEPTHTDVHIQTLVQKILPSNKVTVKKVYLDYGLKDRDPIEKMLFYRKSEPKVAVNVSKDQVSVILPEKFAECIIRVYTKDTDEGSKKKCAEAFAKWCTQTALRPKIYQK